MKRFVLLTFLLLTACSPLTGPGSFFNRTPAPFNLNSESTPEQVQSAMLESAAHWTNLQMNGTITYYLPDGSTQVFSESVSLDPLNNRFRVEVNGVMNASEKSLKISDGIMITNANLNSGVVQQVPYPDFAKVGQFVPQLGSETVFTNPIWGQIGTPLAQLAFPSDYAQNNGFFTVTGVKPVLGRDALVVEWTYAGNAAPSFRAWLDPQTAVILKLQEFGKDGNGTLQSERVVDSIQFDIAMTDTLFAIPVDLPQAAVLTPVGANPVVAESGPVSAEEAGELYFFLQPRQAGKSIELVKVSGMCVYEPSTCPPMEKISVPFPFNFTINALAWSPDGKYAAFSYSDAPSGTPTKLWLLDAEAKTWKSIVQFPFIDPPFWSPDGAWIAFRTQDGVGGEDVHVIRPDGSDLKSVSASLPSDGRPYIMDGWSGDSILMRSALTGKVFLVHEGDGAVTPMMEAQLNKSQFVVSPDASHLVYDDYNENTQVHSLNVMLPDGSNTTTVAQFIAGSIYPIVWSPDGNLLAFNYYQFNNEPLAEVHVVTRTGENLSKVYTGSTVGRLLFSPNGQYLLVEETTSSSGGHLFLINLATLEQKILQAPGLSTDYDWYAPSWRP